MPWFRRVRSGERRDVGGAFFTLFGLVASHQILETARDALFLAALPASWLPLVYLCIAGLTLTIALLRARLSREAGRRRTLLSWLVGASAATAALWLGLPHLGDPGLLALYVWTGVLTTLILIHLWSLLGDLFSVTQAKRLYGLIGTGSVLGAIVGSAAAGALAQLMPTRHLLLLGAAGLMATAACALLLRDPGPLHTAETTPKPKARTDPRPAPGRRMFAPARALLRQTYPRRLLGLAGIAAVTLTLADYVFKATAAAHLAPEALAGFFALVSFAVNLLALVIQVGLVARLLRHGVISSLMILPAFMALGGVLLALAGGMLAALTVKGADATLRHSLHRTATEVLYVPLSGRLREATKTLADVAGQRGGQALASLLILAAVSLGAPPAVLGLLLILAALVWLASLWRLRRVYIDLFRGRIRTAQPQALERFPALDLASLETLFAALDSTSDAEVLAALDILEREGRAHLVPLLLLYHPSPAVVEHAAELFTRTGRTGAIPALARLREHPSDRVRMAMVAAHAALASDEQWLRMHLSHEDSPAVRATIMVNLVAAGAMVGSDARDTLAPILAHGAAETRVALADAIGRRGAAGFADALLALARAPEPEVRRAAVRAMGRAGEAQGPHGRAPMLDALVDLLGDEITRDQAGQALVAHGERGIEALRAAMQRRDLPPALRWRLPRTVALFDPPQAAAVLIEQLPGAAGGMTHFQIIRALESLRRRDPDLALDRRVLAREIDAAVSRAYRYIERRLHLVHGARQDPARQTEGHALLIKMLADKTEHTVDRLFRLLALAHPGDDFSDIRRGLRSPRPDVRASCVELAENLLRPPLRAAVVALIDDRPDRERLDAAGGYHRPALMSPMSPLSYEDVLAQMLDSQSTSVQDITLYHIGELRLVRFRERIPRLSGGALRSDAARTLRLLEEAALAG